jgi:photosystem II stability/assembly factor-like uncharacterized protein
MPIAVLNDAQSGVGYVGALEKKGNVVWAVGGAWGSPLVMTADGGRKFRRRKPPEANGLRDILPIDEKHALAVGEVGGLFETKDAETWTQIPTGTTGCLFAIERAQGSIWISGDDAFVLTSADGTAWRKPRLGKHLKDLGRIQKLTHALGALWLLGYEGKLGVLKKDEVELVKSVESETPLCAIAFSPRGVGLVVGDGGVVYRTKNKGKTWERTQSALDVDLEDVAFHDGRFVIVGEEGTLVVTDDGETFRKVDTGREEHLWCVMSDGAGVLVGGDGGLVIRADDATLAESKPITLEETEEEEDEEDPEIPDAVRLADDSPISEEDLAKASKRWIEEGTLYYDKLNAYVAQFYTDEEPALSAEPEETRKDMATFVQRAAVQLNREKRFDDLRRMFPPSYEAFEYEDIGRTIQPALYVDAGILARIDGRVHFIEGEKIEAMPDVIAFGRSRDRKHLAITTGDHVEIRGGLQRAAHAKLALPKNVGSILTIDVFPDGARALVASETGVYVLSERGSETIHGGEGEMSYVHAALSPDGRIIACGDQDSAHRIFTTEGGRFVLAAEVEPASSYPCFAMFHDTQPNVCLSSCHFAGSASIAMDLGLLKNKKKKSLQLSAGDDRVVCIDDRRWMYCGIARETGYLLGDRSGYAWLFAFDGQLLGYYHVGSTMESMDVNADNTRILFGTCAGLLVEFDRTTKEKDTFHVHSFDQGREARRWVFWKGFPQLVW